MKKIEQNGIAWIDISNPTKEKIETISKLFKLHPLVQQELLNPTFRAKIDSYDDVLYLVIHVPVYDQAAGIARPHEIDIVLGRKMLATAHYNDIPPLKEFFQKLENDAPLQKATLRINTVKLVYDLLLALFAFASRELGHIDEKISRIERDIFLDREKEMVRHISILRSDIINFSRAMKPLKPVFEEFTLKTELFFGKEWSLYFTNIRSEYAKMMNIVLTQSQIIHSLQTTNDSLLSFHINRFLKILAIINLLTIPIILIEAIVAMRWYMQEIIGPFAGVELLIVILSAALFDILLLWFFHSKKWF